MEVVVLGYKCLLYFSSVMNKVAMIPAFRGYSLAGRLHMIIT